MKTKTKTKAARDAELDQHVARWLRYVDDHQERLHFNLSVRKITDGKPDGRPTFTMIADDATALGFIPGRYWSFRVEPSISPRRHVFVFGVGTHSSPMKKADHTSKQVQVSSDGGLAIMEVAQHSWRCKPLSSTRELGIIHARVTPNGTPEYIVEIPNELTTLSGLVVCTGQREDVPHKHKKKTRDPEDADAGLVDTIGRLEGELASAQSRIDVLVEESAIVCARAVVRAILDGLSREDVHRVLDNLELKHGMLAPTVLEDPFEDEEDE